MQISSDSTEQLHAEWHRPEEAERLFMALAPDGPWHVTAIYESGAARVDGDLGNAPTRTFGPDTAKGLRRWISRRVGKANLYFTPNRASATADKKPSKADIEGARVVHTEIDEHEGVHLAFDAERKAKVIENLRACTKPGPPTAIIDSGGGVQAIWVLAEEVGIDLLGSVEDMNRGVLERFDGDARTFNVDRLLRLPGTINVPDEKKRGKGRTPAPARIIDLEPRRTYDYVFDFPLAKAAPKAAVAENVEFGDPVPVEDLDGLAADYGLSDKLVAVIREGDPDMGDGSSSEAFWYATTRLVKHGVPNDLILGLMTDARYPGLYEHVKDNPRGPDLYAERELRRAIEANTAELAADFPDDVDEEVSGTDSTKPKGAARFQRWTVTDIMERDPPSWLVTGWIPSGGLVQLYGARKRNKTFVALDLALCIATGRPFHGVTTTRGRVTYVIGEGGAERFADRVQAWCRYNKVDPAALTGWFDIVPVRVGVDNKTDLRDFLAADKEPRTLTIFDTLARSMDGDENSTHDMNVAIKGLDRVREHYRGAVLVVHHSGKDEARQGRGSTALPGAVDATLKVFKDVTGLTVLQLEESRDAEAGTTFRFEPVQVVLSDDLLRTSLAMRGVEGVGGIAASLSTEDAVLVRIVEEGGVTSRDEIVDSTKPGFSRSSVHRVIATLLKNGLIEGTGPIFATKAGQNRALELGAGAPEDTSE